MSIDIDWENLTTGADGLHLAESIRDFIHDKFQQVALPRFIRAVEVHSFEFGKECPVVELKDICDPLPEFYEDDEDVDEEEEGEELSGGKAEDAKRQAIEICGVQACESLRQRQEASSAEHVFSGRNLPSGASSRPSYIDTRLPTLRSNLSLADQFAGPLLSRSSTPGIPGGTSNLSYFHLPLSAGLSGTQTPLAAVAGGNPYTAAWQDHHAPPWEHHLRRAQSPQRQPQHYFHQDHSYEDPSTRPSTAHSHVQSPNGGHRADSIDGTADEPPSPPTRHEPDAMDLQVVLRITYSGDVRLSLTAEILLDYPMPSFVGIPLKLNITGLSFDGVALIAYLRKRAHFCFLGQEDAEILVGAESAVLASDEHVEGQGDSGTHKHGEKLGGLLREIRVESEIGQKEGGKQVLKNVGKVEKFVLDQVRRIFEEEFVYPSFWTFLV
ncbi:Mitochondrial distribution and morphology protein 12 [Xylographa carneopallida]|nr:Mitochondrial distribution and morphology protein 12 [Xylographa carneopallida]